MQYSSVHGYNISKLTLGTAALGMTYGISNKEGRPAPAECRKVLSCALENGITSIDTARSYGDAEGLVGDFLSKQESRNKVSVITKFKISPENVFNMDRARKQAFESLRSSMEVLKMDIVPICLFHMDHHLPVQRVLEVVPRILEDMKNDGIIDIGGVSIDHPSEAELFFEPAIIETMQVPVNIFDQQLISSGFLKRMKAMNRVVFARSVFLQGLFFIPPGELKGGLSEAGPYISQLQELADRSGMTIPQMAFSFIRDTDGITSVVFGAVYESQVKQNIDLLQGDAISVEVRESAASLFAHIPENIIRPRLWAF